MQKGSNIKWYEEIRKIATGQGEDYTAGCLVDYDYIKNHYRLITVNLSRQKELEADPKAFQRREFAGQLKNTDGVNSDGIQSIIVLVISEKIKETRLKLFQRNVKVL